MECHHRPTRSTPVIPGTKQGLKKPFAMGQGGGHMAAQMASKQLHLRLPHNPHLPRPTTNPVLPPSTLNHVWGKGNHNVAPCLVQVEPLVIKFAALFRTLRLFGVQSRVLYKVKAIPVIFQGVGVCF